MTGLILWLGLGRRWQQLPLGYWDGEYGRENPAKKPQRPDNKKDDLLLQTTKGIELKFFKFKNKWLFNRLSRIVSV